MSLVSLERVSYVIRPVFTRKRADGQDSIAGHLVCITLWRLSLRLERTLHANKPRRDTSTTDVHLSDETRVDMQPETIEHFGNNIVEKVAFERMEAPCSGEISTGG